MRRRRADVTVELRKVCTICIIICMCNHINWWHFQARKDEQMLKRRNISLESELTPLSETNSANLADLTIPEIVQVTITAPHIINDYHVLFFIENFQL